VGVMLYEALVGHLPHRGAVHQLVSQKLFSRPAAPIELVPETPLDLSELALALLDREPERRPDGRELSRLFAVEVPSLRPPESEARPVQAPFVGRVAELAALHAAFDRVATGRPVIVNVSGESGIGKSALAEAFLRDIREDPSVLVLFGRCYEHESVPYKAFDQIADALSGYLARESDGDVALLAPREPSALTTLFPVLARITELAAAEGERAVPLDPTELRLRGFAAVRELLARLAQKRRLVLVVDDLQWSDDDSALLLKEVFGAAGAPRCLLLATSRESRPPALSKLLSALHDRNASEAHFEELRLSGLSESESRELARHAWAKRETELPFHPIAEEAKGNPFFLLALSRHAAESIPSGSLSSFMRGWFQALPDTALELLRVIAVAGRPVDESAASAVVGGGDAAGDLFYLSANHFIGAWPTPARRVECYHDRIREAVLADLDAQELRRLHGRLGNVLEKIEGTALDALATHFLAA
jgi:predicted ATPase